MSVASDRIQFLSLTMSDSAIARQTGIPRITVTMVRLETRRLRPMYDLPLRRAYEQKTYHMLRDAGVSSYESRRFQWYSPTKLRNLVNDINTRVQFYAQGIVAGKINVLTAEGKTVDFEKLYAEAIEQVKEGINRSRESLEDIIRGHPYA